MEPFRMLYFYQVLTDTFFAATSAKELAGKLGVPGRLQRLYVDRKDGTTRHYGYFHPRAGELIAFRRLLPGEEQPFAAPPGLTWWEVGVDENPFREYRKFLG